MLKAIIFDMDGVLVNSTGINRKSFNKVFEKYGVNIQQSNNKKYLGRALSDQRKMWKEDYTINESLTFEIFQKESLKYQLEFMEKELKSDPFVQKLIQEAKAKGIKIAVATSSSKERAIKLLELVEVYSQLDTFVTCEDVEKSKPNPDIFLKAAELLGIEPGNCIVIEDALNGIQAAQEAKMKTAGKIGPHHTKEEFNMADIVFSDFGEITIESLEKVFE